MSYDIVLGSYGPEFPITLTENGGDFTLEVDDVVTLRYIDPDDETHEVTMTVVDAEAGDCEYIWVDGDLPVVGAYKGQVTVTRDGDVTFPRIFPSDGSKIIWWVYEAI